MIVEMHNKLGQPRRVEATRLVVRDPVVGVVAVVIEAGPNQFFAVHLGDGDEAVNRALASIGINETVVTDQVDMSIYDTPPGELILKPGDRPNA